MRLGLVGTGRIGAFHAETLLGLERVTSLVVTDADPVAAEAVGSRLGAEVMSSPEAVLASGVDGLVIATATPGHAPTLRLAVAAGVPAFCEKPVASTLAETLALAEIVAASGVAVHVGFQRRFDAGYRRAAEAVRSGELGFVHTVRAMTHDQSPPPAAYVPTSGGLFRDCSIHDADIVRFVTGREVVTAYAAGGTKGASFFPEAGDVDTGAAVLTLDDGTLVLLSATRYNGAGCDVRMEVHGSIDTIGVGFDDSLAVTSAEPSGITLAGPRHDLFMDRFLPAYRAELTAFTGVVGDGDPSPCTVDDALQAFRIAEACDRSRREGRPVDLASV